MTSDPYNADNAAVIAQLQQQQALFTQSLKAMLENRWVGESSVEAFLYALDPTITGTLDIDKPVAESELDEPPKV